VALAADASAGPRFRTTPLFSSAYLRRSEGRFREAAEILEKTERPIAEDGTARGPGLSLRGSSALEGATSPPRAPRRAGDPESPGVPTRYLFARGMLELRQGRLADARKSAGEIEKHALPAGEATARRTRRRTTSRHGPLAEGKPAEAVERAHALGRARRLRLRDLRTGLAEATWPPGA